jgi:hypothetical protein
MLIQPGSWHHLGYSRWLEELIMEEAACIEMHHVAEAINYGAFDRKLFGEKSKGSKEFLNMARAPM